MTVKKIIERYLRENGYDGLTDAFGDCACFIGDLMPCESTIADCIAGHKVPCPGPEECDLGSDCQWHIKEDKCDSCHGGIHATHKN